MAFAKLLKSSSLAFTTANNPAIDSLPTKVVAAVICCASSSFPNPSLKSPITSIRDFILPSVFVRDNPKSFIIAFAASEAGFESEESIPLSCLNLLS